MPYYIRHLIRTRTGVRTVDFKQVLCEPCKICKKEVPQIYFGLDTKSVCAVEAVYTYKTSDIIEESSNIKKEMIGRICKRKGCDKTVYS